MTPLKKTIVIFLCTIPLSIFLAYIDYETTSLAQVIFTLEGWLFIFFAGLIFTAFAWLIIGCSKLLKLT